MTDIAYITLPNNQTYNLADSIARTEIENDPNKLLIVTADTTKTYDFVFNFGSSLNRET